MPATETASVSHKYILINYDLTKHANISKQKKNIILTKRCRVSALCYSPARDKIRINITYTQWAQDAITSLWHQNDIVTFWRVRWKWGKGVLFFFVFLFVFWGGIVWYVYASTPRKMKHTHTLNLTYIHQSLFQLRYVVHVVFMGYFCIHNRL